MDQIKVLADRLSSLADAGDKVLLVYPPGTDLALPVQACVAADLTPLMGPADGAASGTYLSRINRFATESRAAAMLTTASFAGTLKVLRIYTKEPAIPVIATDELALG